jgi:hypothetical protein
MNDKRKRAEALVYETMDILDKTKSNSAKYRTMFGAMSDDQFDKWAKAFMADPDRNFYLEVRPFENEPVLGEIKRALEHLDIPSEEYVYLRHDGDHSPVRTAHRVPVGYLTMKRMQQVLAKKNTYSLDIDKRDMTTNQVTGDDKIARVSDAENFALTVMGADAGLQELLGPRADNRSKKREMYQSIYSSGYCQLKNMSSNPEDSQALSAADVFFLSAGLKTDLITPGYALPRTLKKLSQMQKTKGEAAAQRAGK